MVVIIFAETVTESQSNDSGSGAKKDLSVFRSPTAEKKIGSYSFSNYFGQVATDGSPAKVFRAHFTDPNDFRPVPGGDANWEQFWTDAGSGKKSDYTLWRVKASAIPGGYKCLSPYFFQRADGRPAPTDAQLSGMVFVADYLCKLVDRNNYTPGWNDHGTGARADVSLAIANDGIGYLATHDHSSSPPNPSVDYTLNFQSPSVKLVQTWAQLNATISANTSASLFPKRIVGDSHVLSMTTAVMDAVYAGNADNFRKYTNDAYDCEDFAAEMRAAVARNCHDDPISNDLKVGCFCGTAYLLPITENAGHGMNIHLQADGTCAMFEPQNGQHITVAKIKQDYTFEGVYF